MGESINFREKKKAWERLKEIDWRAEGFLFENSAVLDGISEVWQNKMYKLKEKKVFYV